MTTLEQVRAKIIEAGSEINQEQSYDCVCGHSKFNHNWHLNYGSSEQIRDDCFHCVCKKFAPTTGRPITLADVLRAIPEGHWKIYMSYDKPGYLCFSDFHDMVRWNLALPLDGQEEEVIEFIGKVLGV